MNQLYPVFLKLDEIRCLVVGAGEVACRKVEALLECNGIVSVVAPKVCRSVMELHAQERIALYARRFELSDLDGIRLAVASTNDSAVNELVWNECEKRNILCNVVDVPEHCRFFAASTLTQGHLKIAISTNGKCPAMAKRIRRRLEKEFDGNYARAIERIGHGRELLRSRFPHDPKRRMDALRAISESEKLYRALENHDESQLEAILDSWISCLSD